MDINTLIMEIRNLADENLALKTQLKEQKEANRRLSARESCYQSEIQKIKNGLQKLYQSIDTSPHSSNSDYRVEFYGETCKNEEIRKLESEVRE